jgi:hypothetical protein
MDSHGTAEQTSKHLIYGRWPAILHINFSSRYLLLIPIASLSDLVLANIFSPAVFAPELRLAYVFSFDMISVYLNDLTT